MSDINYTELHQKIAESGGPEGMAKVLKEAGFFRVGINLDAHNGDEPTRGGRLTWAALDTAWDILREYAVRVALAEIREQLTEQNVEGMPSDEEVFQQARESGDPEAAKSYLDLAPDRGDGTLLVEVAGRSLQGAFEALANQAYDDAVAAFSTAAEGLGDGAA